jgi:hypothetical protein
LRHQRMRLIKKNKDLVSPYFSQELSVKINEFILDNVNEDEETLSKMINNEFGVDLSVVAVRNRKNRELGIYEN